MLMLCRHTGVWFVHARALTCAGIMRSTRQHAAPCRQRQRHLIIAPAAVSAKHCHSCSSITSHTHACTAHSLAVPAAAGQLCSTPVPCCALQDIKEALRRLPQDVVLARNARLKRAMDLSMKHEHLPKELQEKQTPFDHYLLVSAPAGVAVMRSCVLHLCLAVRGWLLHCSSSARDAPASIRTAWCSQTWRTYLLPPALAAAALQA